MSRLSGQFKYRKKKNFKALHQQSTGGEKRLRLVHLDPHLFDYRNIKIYTLVYIYVRKRVSSCEPVTVAWLRIAV